MTKDYALSPDAVASNATLNAQMLALYNAQLKGPYTISRGNSVAFQTLQDVSTRDTTVRLMEKVQRQKASDFLPGGTESTVLEGFERQKELLANYVSSGRVAIQEVAFGGSGGAALALEKPFSRGTININSNDPWADPVVDYRVLSNPVDLDIMVQMVKWLWKLYQAPALQELGAKCLSPDPAASSDDEIKAQIAAILVPSFAHPSSTCSMMRKEYGGVVSSDLLVYGVKHLSIVDASIIPMTPATHIQSTVYAISEKVRSSILPVKFRKCLLTLLDFPGCRYHQVP